MKWVVHPEGQCIPGREETGPLPPVARIAMLLQEQVGIETGPFTTGSQDSYVITRTGRHRDWTFTTTGSQDSYVITRAGRHRD